MAKKKPKGVDCTRLELDGIRYVVLREAIFEQLCQKAQVPSGADTTPSSALDVDSASLADKLLRRRQAVGLSQAELARRAGVRPETLNRIERGKTTPDFATVRKLVVAMNAVELEAADLR